MKHAGPSKIPSTGENRVSQSCMAFSSTAKLHLEINRPPGPLRKAMKRAMSSNSSFFWYSLGYKQKREIAIFFRIFKLPKNKYKKWKEAV